MAFVELAQSYPKSSILVLAALVTLLVQLIQFFVLDKERMREIKKSQKELNKKMKEHRKNGEHDKALELSKEMMTYTGEMMKHTMKPLLITIIPIIFIFSYIKGIYSETSIAESWLWYYIGGALVAGIVFRKVLRLP